eukprot:8253424-Pyramimonas_sp.AAC.1
MPRGPRHGFARHHRPLNPSLLSGKHVGGVLGPCFEGLGMASARASHSNLALLDPRRGDAEGLC